MYRNKIILSAICLFLTSSIWAKPLVLTEKELNSPPPRIIRTCCSFGSDVGVIGIPFIKITDITSVGELGHHSYLGNPEEGNGIIYTKQGGFIDMGHLRDQADWTAYLFTLMIENRDIGYINQPLGHEGGDKNLNIQIPQNLSYSDLMLLSGRIAYDLSIWHEIATWFGASYIPMIPERYSSFSVEDAYSNLLGVTIGIEAIKSNLPYEEAMTLLIQNKLSELGAVKTEDDTYAAMEAVRNIWWTRDKHLPSGKILLERQLNVYSRVKPMIVPTLGNDTALAYVLNVPTNTVEGESLSDFYKLEFKLNYKFPVKKILPDEAGRTITQQNFETLIQHVEEDCKIQEMKANPEEKALLREYRKEKRQRNRLRQRNVTGRSIAMPLFCQVG